ncbi:MAG: class I SAM-dependent methyltransferase [Polyangiaceae bacterium]
MQAPVRALLDLHHRRVRLPRAARVATALAAQIGRAEAVLDVGCDDGRVLAEVAARVGARRVVGVDVQVNPAARERGVEVVPFDGEVLLPRPELRRRAAGRRAPPLPAPEVVLREALRVARRVVAVKDHFELGPLSHLLLEVMDRVGNAAHHVAVRATYFTPGDFSRLVERAGGRVRGLWWPLRIHDLPFRLLTQDRLQFAARIEPLPAEPGAHAGGRR